MVTPSDDVARTRFANELDRNFSVVASAGSGKTTAITRRVLSVAKLPNAAEILPRLVVVTFTHRAADEMQQRARQVLLEQNFSPEVQSAFNRAFFGTIHSFCTRLLNEHGHHLGLPAPLELLSDDDDLWQEFVQTQTRIGHSLGAENRAALLRLVQARDLMELARRAGAEALPLAELHRCPETDFAQVHAQVDDKGRDNIRKSQAELRDWEERFAAGWRFLRWPTRFTSDNSNFSQLWTEKFRPLRKWVCDAAICVAAEIQRDYREFRLERGLVTYGDQIALAKELLQHPAAGPRIREENFCVILDEAQDTEPAQFFVLVEATRPATARGSWLETRAEDPPQPGHFCMVGDFQQSIYRERADLGFYRAVHQALVNSPAGEALTFSVTYRLDEKQLAFVNQTFREILNGGKGQENFVELHPRPEVLPGKVIRVPISDDILSEIKASLPEGKQPKDYQKARAEAWFVAKWIAAAGFKKLAARSWREVAILCPRKAWLQTMAAALRRENLPVAIQSERDVKGDSPAYAWLTALCTIMSEPRNSFEIVGVLREIFGVSDHDLAVFSEGEATRFWIDRELSAVGKVSSHLRELAEIQQRSAALPLFDALMFIARETQLRERLLVLPEKEFGDLGRELDALLAQAAQAEADGMILSGFAERLRDEFTTPRNVRFTSDEAAIQLITTHKAKGSEWDAVIVPFLARELRPPSPRYPHLVRSPATGEFFLAMSKDDKSRELKESIELAQHQETERLLYVATTRARRALVLILDHEVFCDSKKQLLKSAQLRRLMRGKNSYAGEFDDCTSLLEDCAEEMDVGAAPLSEPKENTALRLSAREINEARRRASDFMHKFTPSSYDAAVAEASNEQPEMDGSENRELHPIPDTPATLYGRWWHRLFEKFPWTKDVDEAEEIFRQHQLRSPDAARSLAEWRSAQKNLLSDDRIRRFISRPNAQAHSEFPFAWSVDQRSCVEGIIDFFFADNDLRAGLLLDWKTNRLRAGDEEKLRAFYRPQIAAYWKAATAITALEIEAGLYSTALGKLLIYSTAELTSEWERLAQLPREKFAAEIIDASDSIAFEIQPERAK